jgi:ribA/ribD-fused uncharacterized protein
MKSKFKDIIYFYEPEDEYGWLANFSDHPITIKAIYYKTVEHYFQSQKFTNNDIKNQVIRSINAEQAKLIAKENKDKRVGNWADIKEQVMARGIYAKFTQYEDLKLKLIQTGNKIIVEKTIDDYYWGCGLNNNGLNRMGVLLMKLRNKISDKNAK